MKTTIMDVARQAGVSMKTVSRVLNNEPNVTDKTREKVMLAAKALRYQPNLSARGLASSKSYMLALLYDNAAPEYLSEIQAGALSVCREKSYHLVVEQISVHQATVEDGMNLLLSRLPVDGIILTPPLSESPTVIRKLLAAGKKVSPIAPKGKLSGVSYVFMDDEAAAAELTQHLLDLGHQKIGFIGGHPEHRASEARRAGFIRAMKAAGLTAKKNWQAEGDFTLASGQNAAREILKQDDRPTALFVCNDNMAAGAMRIAREMGLSIPGDLSVCGFDDTILASAIWPPLTTIRQPMREMGRTAASRLITATASPEETGLAMSLEYEMVIRASTGKI